MLSGKIKEITGNNDLYKVQNFARIAALISGHLVQTQLKSTFIFAILYLFLKTPVLSCFVRSFEPIYSCSWWQLAI